MALYHPRDNYGVLRRAFYQSSLCIYFSCEDADGSETGFKVHAVMVSVVVTPPPSWWPIFQAPSPPPPPPPSSLNLCPSSSPIPHLSTHPLIPSSLPLLPLDPLSLLLFPPLGYVQHMLSPSEMLVATQIQSDSNTELGGVLTGACKNSVASLLVVQLRDLYETSLGVKATHLLLRIVLPCEAFAGKLRKLPGMSRMHFWQHGCQQTLSGKVAMKQKWIFHENMENLSMSMESCVMGSSWTIKYPWQLFFCSYPMNR